VSTGNPKLREKCVGLQSCDWDRIQIGIKERPERAADPTCSRRAVSIVRDYKHKPPRTNAAATLTMFWSLQMGSVPIFFLRLGKGAILTFRKPFNMSRIVI